MCFALPGLAHVSELSMNGGDGPRHLEFHPSLDFAYVASELSCMVTVCHSNVGTGALGKVVQTRSTLPAGFVNDGSNTCAHIMAHPSGKFLYVSNRGGKCHTLALFLISADGGSLSECEQSGDLNDELCPRAFNISPDGLWMVIAYQDSSKLVSYKIDLDSGRLVFAHKLSMPTPVCLAWCDAADETAVGSNI